MSKWNASFEALVVAELRRLAADFHLDPAEPGDDQVLATAVVTGLTGASEIEPVVLGVVGREDGITVEVRNVCFAGSPGATSNRTVSYILGRILTPRDAGDGLEREHVELCGMLADVFRGGNRTTDDLIAMIVAGSNLITLRTSAAVDFRDGEVVVDTFLPCDADALPAEFESAVGRVLQHAAMIQRTVNIVRDLLSPDPLPAPRSVARLVRKLHSCAASDERTREGEAAEPEPAEQVLL